MKKINLFFIAAVSMSMLIACSGKNAEQTTVAEKVESVKVENATVKYFCFLLSKHRCTP